MSLEIAIIGAGIIGITNAVYLLEKGFKVTVFTKDPPHSTNSDVAVATWYAPDNDKPVLQEFCLDSLSRFDEISKVPDSGVQRIPIIHYFKDEEDFEKSIWASENLRAVFNITDELPANYVKNKDFRKAVLMYVPLIDVNIYRPFIFSKFIELGGKLEVKEVSNLTQLANFYDIVIISAGWESKYLSNDPSVYPVRGQTEIAKIDESIKGICSVNIRDINGYVIFRPQSNDCVIGTTYQVNSGEKETSNRDKDNIIKNITPFFPEAPRLKTTSKVGIRCGRTDVLIESKIVNNDYGKKICLINCYGHGGSGFSASWGTAKRVFEHCLSYTSELNRHYRHKL